MRSRVQARARGPWGGPGYARGAVCARRKHAGAAARRLSGAGRAQAATRRVLQQRHASSPMPSVVAIPTAASSFARQERQGVYNLLAGASARRPSGPLGRSALRLPKALSAFAHQGRGEARRGAPLSQEPQANSPTGGVELARAGRRRTAPRGAFHVFCAPRGASEP